MSMSTHIRGLRSPDSPEHQKMVAAAIALGEAGIEQLPEVMRKYFGCYEAGEVKYDPSSGCAVDIEVVESNPEMQNVFTVDVRTLPEGVTHIQFTNSY